MSGCIGIFAVGYTVVDDLEILMLSLSTVYTKELAGTMYYKKIA